VPRMRITITADVDRREQLRLASRIRQRMIEDLHPRLNAEHPLNGIHRNPDGRPYLEFEADAAAVEVLIRREFADRAGVSLPTETLGEPCANCGNIAGADLPIACPNCGFRDIDPCPICGEPIPRRKYRKVGGSLFVCPHPVGGHYHRVRLAFNDPMFESDGAYRQPLVVVSPVEE
jgi:hypothetical protein